MSEINISLKEAKRLVINLKNKKEYKEALTFINKYFLRYGENSPLLIEKGVISYILGEYEEAYSCFFKSAVLTSFFNLGIKETSYTVRNIKRLKNACYRTSSFDENIIVISKHISFLIFDMLRIDKIEEIKSLILSLVKLFPECVNIDVLNFIPLILEKKINIEDGYILLYFYIENGIYPNKEKIEFLSNFFTENIVLSLFYNAKYSSSLTEVDYIELVNLSFNLKNTYLTNFIIKEGFKKNPKSIGLKKIELLITMDTGGIDEVLNWIELNYTYFKEALPIYIKEPFDKIFNSGDIEGAYKIKNKIASMVFKQKTHTFKNLECIYQWVSAPFYLGEYSESLERIRRISKIEMKSYYLTFKSLEVYCEIMENDFSWKEKMSSLLKMENDFYSNDSVRLKDNRDYFNIIKGKKIAIVGPADTFFENGDEIDLYDVVIRTNVTSFDFIYNNKNKIGSKTNVVYYATSFPDYEKNEKLNFYKKTKDENGYIVFRMVNQYNLLLENSPPGWFKKETRQLKPFASTSTGLHAIQRIIWDILKFRPKNVKVFNIDFFIKKDSYLDNNYAGRDMKNRIGKISKLGPRHCLLQSYTMLKDLYERDIIEVDNNIKDILLSTSKEEYIKILHENYSVN